MESIDHTQCELLIEKLKNYYLQYQKLAECAGEFEPLVDNGAALLGCSIQDRRALIEYLHSIIPLSDNDFFIAFQSHPDLIVLKQTIEYATKPSDSCGDISSQIGELILENPIKFTAESISKFDILSPSNIEPFMAKIKTLKGPHVIRVDIERCKEGTIDQWASSHSYLILVKNRSEGVHILQAYAGCYTFQEWLKDYQYETLKSYSLEQHMELLAKLHCETWNESTTGQTTRGEIYSTLFRTHGKIVPSKSNPMKVYCAIQPLVPTYGLRVLRDVESNIIDKKITNQKDFESINNFLADKILLKAGFDDATLRHTIIATNNRFESIRSEAEENPSKYYGM